MAASPSLTRRGLLGRSAALGLASLWNPPVFAAPQRKPNILYIMADDLGYADLGCYGSRHIRTSNIDRLASEGLKLSQGYANSPVCSATRTALITGRYQYRLPCGLEEPISFNDVGLPADVPTLPSLLQKQGYYTALVGKWHLGKMGKYSPLERGYQSFFGVQDGGSDYFSHGLKGRKNLYDGDQLASREGYLTDLFGERTLTEIDKAQDLNRPFYISLHFTAPHWPWEGPEDEALAKTVTNPMHYDGGDLSTYAKMVESMDANIGRLLDYLEQSGQADDTIIIFTSDNGGERFSDTWPLIGSKTELLEGGIRVPLVIRWPSRIAAGSESDQVMVSMDMVPTLLAASGASAKGLPSFDGENLLAVLTGQTTPKERTLFWRYNAADQAAMRSGKWKYLKIRDREFLFDLANDEHERANRKAHEPEIFERMKQQYTEWNATMLPYTEKNYTHSISSDWADRYEPVTSLPPPPGWKP